MPEENITQTAEQVEKAVEEKQTEIKKVAKVVDFVKNKENKVNFYKKLAEIQGEEIIVEKNMYMKFKDYHYANLDDILKAYKPLLTKFGLVVVNNVDIETMILTTRIIDIENPELEEKATWKIFWKNSQELWAALTYGKRYLITALLNVATGEDFDGHTPEEIEKKATQKIEVKPKTTTQNNKTVIKNTVAPTPKIENNPVQPKKKVFWISEKQLSFCKDLYKKYSDMKGTEAWTLEKILTEKYSWKKTLEELNWIQAKDFIDEMLKRV